MRHSTFRQPLPAQSEAADGRGLSVSGKDKPYGFEFVGPAPAGSLSATRRGHGPVHDRPPPERAGRQRILQPQTAQLMHSRAEPADPGPQRHGARLLRAQHQRAPGRSPTAATRSPSTATCTCSSTKASGCTCRSTAAGRKARPPAARRTVRAIRRPLFPGAGRHAKARRRKRRSENAEKLAGVYSTSRGSLLELPRHHRPDRPDKDQRRQGRQARSFPSPTVSTASRANGSRSGPMLWRDANGHETARRQGRGWQGRALQLRQHRADHRLRPDALVPESSAWLLPLLYVSPGGAAADGVCSGRLVRWSAAHTARRSRSKAPSLRPIARAGSRRSPSLACWSAGSALITVMFERPDQPQRRASTWS